MRNENPLLLETQKAKQVTSESLKIALGFLAPGFKQNEGRASRSGSSRSIRKRRSRSKTATMIITTATVMPTSHNENVIRQQEFVVDPLYS